MALALLEASMQVAVIALAQGIDAERFNAPQATVQ
jgi:hypothetical protein